MNTYKVMMVDAEGYTKTRVIVASSESQAKQFSCLNTDRSYVPKFALQIAKGSPSD